MSTLAPLNADLNGHDQPSWNVVPQQEQPAQVKPQAKEDKPVGGVSAKLDYEMETMADFVTEMAAGMYALFSKRICIADIDLTRSIQPGVQYPPAFRKWVLQVLNATRLPSATILLSLSYLALRVRGLSTQGQFKTSERGLYQMLTVSLILGSKFLDDNTFQNKSWAEVSHISIPELNHDEREWLEAFNHRLHHDPDTQDGFNSWKQRWETYETQVAAIAITALRPVDTNVQRERSARGNFSPSAWPQKYGKSTLPGFPMEPFRQPLADSQYCTPTYSPLYDAWYGNGATHEKSPSTAPHTGPTTPDYYGTYDRWDLQRRNPYHASLFTGSDMPFGGMQQSTLGWNCHGAACQCAGCRQQQWMRPRYGPIAVT